MLQLDVTIEDRSGALGLLTGIRAQLPFATSVALNKTVNAAQEAIQASLASDFTLRHADFIKRTIYRKPGQDFATKEKLQAAVRVNPERDFLAKFETDAEKLPIKSATLAIPVQREQNKGLIIQRGDPRNLKRVMALIENQGGKAVGPFRRRGAKRAQQQSFFPVHSAKGQTLILQRDATTTRVLYAFQKEVPIESHRLHFEEIAERVAIATFDANMNDAIAFAIATAK